MAERAPIVQNTGELEQLQSADHIPYADISGTFGTDEILVIADGTDRSVKAASFGVGVVVTAASSWGSAGLLVESNADDRALVATSIATANVVTAASVYTSGDLIQAAGNDKTTSSSGVQTGDVVTAASAYTSGEIIVAAGNDKTTQSGSIAATDLVTAGSAFTSGDLIQAAGNNKTTSSSGVQTSDVVTASAGFATDNVVIRADGTGKGSQLSLTTIEDTGQMTIATTSALDSVTLGSELLDSSGWTSTGWSGSFAAGYTHNTGNTSALSNSITLSASTIYLLQYTLSGRTAGSHTVTLSSDTTQSLSTNGDRSMGTVAVATSGLAFTPTTDFDGTIEDISLREITAGQPYSWATLDSTGSIVTETRGLRSLLNFSIGINAGEFLATGGSNTLVGPNAGGDMISGQANVCVGPTAGERIYYSDSNIMIGNQTGRYCKGYQNLAIGTQAAGNTSMDADNTVALGRLALFSVTTGDFNLAIGDQAGRSITTGSDNILIGRSAGFNGSQLVTADRSIAIGYLAFNDADDQTILGSTSTDNTFIRGILEVTSEPSAADQLWDNCGVTMVSDGSARSRFFEEYGAGTNYTLTTSAAAVNMGTTDPSITVTEAGDYRVSGWVNLLVNNAQPGAGITVTLTLRRTNNTAADLGDGSVVLSALEIGSAYTNSVPVYWEASEYTTANTDDALTIFASISGSLTSGTIEVDDCFIKAQRIL